MINPLVRLARWIRDEFVQTAPKDVAVCEFECNVTTCLAKDWEACRRRRGMAAQDTDATGFPGDDPVR